MTPYYDEDGITIYHGDCLEHLDVWAGLAEPAVMVTDPPYGIGWSTHGISRTVTCVAEVAWSAWKMGALG